MQIDKVFAQSKQFFSQPLEVKEKMAWTNEQVWTSLALLLILHSSAFYLLHWQVVIFVKTNTGYVGVARERLDPGKPGTLCCSPER
jgi:isopenicillin N synthase-like dioxygenase